jgi:hypothetical protein
MCYMVLPVCLAQNAVPNVIIMPKTSTHRLIAPYNALAELAATMVFWPDAEKILRYDTSKYALS